VHREVVRLVEMVEPTFITLEEVPGFIIHQFPASSMLLWREAKKQRQQQRVQLERLRQRRLQQQHQYQQQQEDMSTAAVSESWMGSGDQDDEEGEEEGDDSLPSESDDPEDLQGVAEAMAAASVNPDKAQDGQVVFHPFTLVVGELLSLGYQVCVQFAAQEFNLALVSTPPPWSFDHMQPVFVLQVSLCLLHGAQFGVPQKRWVSVGH
jgi:hypothetical protein